MADNTGEGRSPTSRSGRERPPGPDQFYGPTEAGESCEQAADSVRSRRDLRVDDSRHYRESDVDPVLPIDKITESRPPSEREHASSRSPAEPENTESGRTTPSRGAASRYSWALSRVIVVAVDSRTAETATTLARVTLDRLKDTDGERLSSDRFRAELTRDLSEGPGQELDARWSTTEAVVPADTAEGDQLQEAVLGTSEWQRDSGRPVSTVDGVEKDIEMDPVLYTEFGEPVVDRDRLDDELTSGTSDERTWLVSAVLFRRELDSEGRRTASIRCRQCARTTTHVYQDRLTELRSGGGAPSLWQCRRCETPCLGKPSS